MKSPAEPIEKLRELLEVTPEILVDDEVSEIENQRFFIETSWIDQRTRTKTWKYEVSKVEWNTFM